MNNNPQQEKATANDDDTVTLQRLNSKLQSHPVAVLASALSRLDNEELAELGKSITPRIAKLYEKSFGPAILPLLTPLTAGNQPAKDEGDEGDEGDEEAKADGNDDGKKTAKKIGKKNAMEKNAEDDADDDDDSKKMANTMAEAEVAELEMTIRTLMRDPRYWRDHDPEQMAKVAQAFEKLYG